MTSPGTDHDVEVLVGWLGNARGHLLAQVQDLSDDDLLRPMLPSQWSIAGLLHHLALDVEAFWFRHVMAGEPFTPSDDEAWDVPEGMTPAEVVALYRAEAENADRIALGMSATTPPAWWPDFFGSYRLDDLREVLLHVLAETNAHAGHLDVVRELIDGKQWIVLTG